MLFASFVVAATLFEAGLAVPHNFSSATTAAASASSVLIPGPNTTVFDVPVPTSAPTISEPVISCVFLSNNTATWDFNFTSSIVSVNATGVAANGTAYITATAFNSSVFATATVVDPSVPLATATPGVSSVFATATAFNSSIVTLAPTSTAHANGTVFPTSSVVVANGTVYPTWTEVVNGTAFPTSTEVNITSIWLPSFPITCFYPVATIVPNVSASDAPTLDTSVPVATANSSTWY